MQLKQMYTITVSVQCEGQTGQTIHEIRVLARSLGHAEAQAKRVALQGLSSKHYAYAFLR